MIDSALGFQGANTVANGINDHGLIVVAATIGNFADGLTVQGSTAAKAPGLPGGSSAAGSTNTNPIAVNNNNLIVGSAVNSAGNEVAAEWQNGKITTLGGLPGGPDPGARGQLRRPGRVLACSGDRLGSDADVMTATFPQRHPRVTGVRRTPG